MSTFITFLGSSFFLGGGLNNILSFIYYYNIKTNQNHKKILNLIIIIKYKYKYMSASL